MGKKAKGSRKGKKAWRANISTDDIEDYFANTTKDALTGNTDIPDKSLFFPDKTTGPTEIPVQRKIEKHREKVLRLEYAFRANPFLQPVQSSSKSKLKKKHKVVPEKKQESTKDVDNSISGLPDIWEGKEAEEGFGQEKKRSVPVAAHIPAVEVEPLGCSFNPPFEAHQDSLAQAVAVEMQKSYRKELGPQPVPLIVLGEPIDEEEKYFLDAEDGDNVDENEDEDNNHDVSLGQIIKKPKRVTRVELNRRARRKERLKAEEEAKRIKNNSKQIDNLPAILKEIAKEDEVKHKKHVRRVIAKKERLNSGPPRLGKHKFEPAPLQVLLSEEISGSIRKLKGCCTLTRDRYKSLQKRGLLAPCARRSRK